MFEMGRMEIFRTLWVCFPLPGPWIGLWVALRMCVQWWGCRVRFKDTTMALLTPVEEDHPREVKGVCSNTRGKRELLNLECSINCDTAGASSRRGKGKAHVLQR